MAAAETSSLRRSGRQPTLEPERRPSGGEPRPPRRALLRRWLRAAFVDNAALKFVAFVLALTLFILVHGDEDAVIGATVKSRTPSTTSACWCPSRLTRCASPSRARGAASSASTSASSSPSTST